MEFISERTAYTMISDTVVKAGVSLFNAVKYIYMIGDKDFYNINVRKNNKNVRKSHFYFESDKVT